ncbi:hypothetical protein FQN60_006251 [Etheostoma spectabile]|uniref:Uncharacterized protein n=1 Tax=Etheostoma spectabile TaxID=54343 RepID=A0A5J5CQD3_9PERO|nr:hypothetical protein FQN60_006251 [Etheostoma spectabile]
MKPVAMALNILQGESSVHGPPAANTLPVVGHAEEVGVNLQNVYTSCLDYIRSHLDADLDDVTSTNSSLSDEDDFFASMELGKSQVGKLERYLSCLSPAGMDLLHTFPHIKKLSLKVNTGLPASAA